MSFTGLVRQGEARDLDAVIELAASASEAPQWTRDVYAEMVQRAPQEAGGGDQVLQRVLLVAESGDSGAIGGFAVVTILLSEAELESVVIATDKRRKGIGKCLCLAGMAWAQAAGAAQVRLEVRASNAGARALYSDLGFAQSGLRREYYRAPVEDAVEMIVQLTVADL